MRGYRGPGALVATLLVVSVAWMPSADAGAGLTFVAKGGATRAGSSYEATFVANYASGELRPVDVSLADPATGLPVVVARVPTRWAFGGFDDFDGCVLSWDETHTGLVPGVLETTTRFGWDLCRDTRVGHLHGTFLGEFELDLCVVRCLDAPLPPHAHEYEGAGPIVLPFDHVDRRGSGRFEVRVVDEAHADIGFSVCRAGIPSVNILAPIDLECAAHCNVGVVDVPLETAVGERSLPFVVAIDGGAAGGHPHADACGDPTTGTGGVVVHT